MIATDMYAAVYDPDAREGRAAEKSSITWWRYGNCHLRPPLTPLTVLRCGCCRWPPSWRARVDNRRPHTRRQVRACAGSRLPADTPVYGARAPGGADYVPGGRHCAGGRRRQLRPDRQLSAGEGLAAGNGANAQAAGAGAGPAGAAAE